MGRRWPLYDSSVLIARMTSVLERKPSSKDFPLLKNRMLSTLGIDCWMRATASSEEMSCPVISTTIPKAEWVLGRTGEIRLLGAYDCLIGGRKGPCPWPGAWEPELGPWSLAQVQAASA